MLSSAYSQPAPTPSGSPVAASILGVFFVALAFFTRLGLHNEVNVIAVPLWIVIGAVSTYVSLGVWRPRVWPGIRIAFSRIGPVFTLLGWMLGAAIIFGPANDSHASDLRRQSRCRSHLESLAFEISMYADAHGGQYPDRPETLLLAGTQADAFVCGSTDDQPARGATPAEVADDFASGGHLSYIYVGKGLTTATTRPDTIVMFEPASNHHRDHPGLHVMYAGERVEYLEGEAALNVMQQMWWDRQFAPTSRPVVAAPPGH